MKNYCWILLLFLIAACNEELMEKPDGLIPEEKMVGILKDLAIVNAAKTTSVAVLQDNDIEPMAYIFKKYDIDSIQFVESDRYYASLPVRYEKIYQNVEAQLEKEAKGIGEEKKINDSLRRLKLENNGGDTYLDKVKDSVR